MAKSRQATAGLSLQQLLVELGYEPRLVVVEFNGTIAAGALARSAGGRRRPAGGGDNRGRRLSRQGGAPHFTA